MATQTTYRYRALDPATKKTISGSLEATSDSQVSARLRAQGLVPLAIDSQSKTGLNQGIEVSWLQKRVDLAQLAVFTRQLSGLINAGVPLLRSIAIVAEQTEHKTLKKALANVQQDIETGSALSAALQRQSEVFPPLMVNVVRVGETGGFLGQALDSLADTYKRDALLRGKIKSATTYPTVILIVALLGVLFMVWFIVPVFVGMFEGLGTDLPIPTQILVNLSGAMVWLGPLLLILTIAGIVLWRRNKNNPKLRKAIDPILLKLPVFGSLNKRIQLSRFARNLSMMLGAGVPLTQALSVMADTVGNEVVRETILNALESVREGGSLSAPIARSQVFPPSLAHMIAVGEESGTLPQMLQSIAEISESEVNTEAEQLTSSIEPILLVFIGLLVGGMVISLYLPMFQLYGDISNM